MDRPISYGFWMYLLHIYLVYYNLMRISYCPNDASFRFDSLFFCRERPRTFVDFVTWIQLVFYTSTLLCHCLDYVYIERTIYLHGSYFVGGSIWSAFWFLPCPQGISFWILDGSSFYSNFGFDAGKNALWVPLLFWLLFLFSRKYYLGMIHWEHENALIEDDQQDAYDAKFVYDTLLLSEQLRYICYSIWIYTLPSISLMIWDFYLKPKDLTDLAIWPGLFWVLFSSFTSTAGMRIFFSMIHFQFKCIAWLDPWKTGIIFRSFEDVQYGIVC